MKKLLLSIVSVTLAACLQAGGVVGGTEHELLSPDGRYSFRFYQKHMPGNTRQMYYTLSYNEKTVVEESELGILIDNRLFELALGIPEDRTDIWCSDMVLAGVQRRSEDSSWVPVYGERNLVKDRYNEITLSFLKGGADGSSADGYDKRRYYSMDIVVRAYDEGVAFRYHFPETDNGLFLHITGEQTGFTFAEGTMAWYERWAQGPYSYLPLVDWPDECERPLTLRTPDGLTVSLTEACMVNYARTKFKLSGDRSSTIEASVYGSVDVITPYSTPWRVIRVAESPSELIAGNDIILNLNPENRIGDTSWIMPGKVIRVSRLTQDDAIKCVDFASERGLQYIHIDAGWYGPEIKVASDALTVDKQRDFDIPDLTAYAASKGIGVMVYVNQRALESQLDDILPLYRQWGIKGIKFGFVQVGNQYWSRWLHEAVKKCAEYGMLVDIHDEYRPTGFSRTYPNLMTQEGIRGNEEMPDATHNTILPFTRYLAGAGDYTICYYNSRIKTTHAHQLALAVIFYSPLQFLYWYDQPSAYGGEPEIEFFDNVKTVWDETVPVSGEIGEFAAIARRSGEEWFVGAITNNDAREMVIPLNFLEPGRKYIAKLYTDDDSAGTRTKVRITARITDNDSELKLSLKGSGGCAMHIVPATSEDMKIYKSHRAKMSY